MFVHQFFTSGQTCETATNWSLKREQTQCTGYKQYTREYTALLISLIACTRGFHLQAQELEIHYRKKSRLTSQ